MIFKKKGYILFLSVSIIGVMTLVVTQLFYLGSLYNRYIPLVIEREQAKQLALSGVNIAVAQLLLQDKQFYSQSKLSKEDKSADEQNPENNKKQLLKTLLTVQNRWQEFILTPENDGFDGTIKICISCENGKINLNKLYDFKKKTFNSIGVNITTEAFLKYITERMKEWFEGIDVQNVFFNILTKKKSLFITPFDLLSYKKCNFLINFSVYLPSLVKDDNNKKTSIYLNDIFTVYSDDFYIDPLLLSNSLRLLLDLKVEPMNYKKEDIQKIIEKISLSNIKWESIWDTELKEFMGKDFKSLPKDFIPLLNSKFEPRVFSVVSCGKIGRVEQKILAILERVTENKQDIISIKQIYWL